MPKGQIYKIYESMIEYIKSIEIFQQLKNKKMGKGLVVQKVQASETKHKRYVQWMLYQFSYPKWLGDPVCGWVFCLRILTMNKCEPVAKKTGFNKNGKHCQSGYKPNKSNHLSTHYLLAEKKYLALGSTCLSLVSLFTFGTSPTMHISSESQASCKAIIGHYRNTNS